MKNKRFVSIVFLGLFAFCLYSSAQITTNEKPISFGLKINLEELPVIKLDTPDLEKVSLEDKLLDETPNPLRFAYPIYTNMSVNKDGNWQTLDDGSKLWKLNLILSGALSTNVIYNKFWLPKGAKFFVYNTETKNYIGAVTSEFIDGTFENPASYSTGVLLGENVTFEYYQPATVTDFPIIEINRIDYGYRFINSVIDALKPYKDENNFQGFRDAGNCNININCSEGNNWQVEKRAVARIMVVSPNGSGWCSGSLINNAKKDYAPYFLTAAHCLTGLDAISNNDAANWIFYWNYEHSGCSNSSVEPQHFTTRGAILKANNSPSDFALLELKQDPKLLNGITPYYLGWDRTGNSVAGGVGIHHPKGDVKKISTYSIAPFNSYCSNSILFWDVSFISTTNGYSIMQPGSSGSPLITANRKIIGQLYGPYSIVRCPEYQCDNPALQQVAYGKFSVSWTGNNATDSRRRLSNWLDPNNTGVTTLDGIDYSPYCATTTVTGTQTTKKVVCDEIIVRDATVPSGVSLELEATGGSVKIYPGFKVESGATFTIK